VIFGAIVPLIVYIFRWGLRADAWLSERGLDCPVKLWKQSIAQKVISSTFLDPDAFNFRIPDSRQIAKKW
jgi:hypothetical protein